MRQMARYFSFLLLIFLFISSCQTLEELENVTPKPELKKAQIISLKQEPSLESVVNSLRLTKLKNNPIMRTSGSPQLGTNRILKVPQKDGTYIYSMALRGDQSGRALQNLVLKQVPGGFIGFILEYRPEKKFIYKAKNRIDLHKFTGTLTRYNLDGQTLSQIQMKDGKKKHTKGKRAFWWV
jgi:hypothetical protein